MITPEEVAKAFISVPGLDMQLVSPGAATPEFKKQLAEMLNQMASARDSAGWSVVDRAPEEGTVTVQASSCTGGGSCWSTTRQHFTLHVDVAQVPHPITRVDVGERITR